MPARRMWICVGGCQLRGFKGVDGRSGGRRTVLSFSPFLLVGTFFHGSQPQPTSRPPGVWYILKLSPSPTLVTWPKIVRRRRKEGEMLGASGKRRRYRRWKRTASRIPLVNSRVGTRVLSSVKAAQSRSEPELFVDGAVSEDEDEELCSTSSFLSLFDSDLHGGHRMTSPAAESRWWDEDWRLSGDSSDRRGRS